MTTIRTSSLVCSNSNPIPPYRHLIYFSTGLKAIQPWHVFADDLRSMRGAVGRAQEVTAEMIQFWSQMRDLVERLQDTSANWLEDPSSEWMAKKLLPEWKIVAQQYSQCAHTVRIGFFCFGRIRGLIMYTARRQTPIDSSTHICSNESTHFLIFPLTLA